MDTVNVKCKDLSKIIMHDRCIERSHNVMDIHSKVMSITCVQT